MNKNTLLLGFLVLLALAAFLLMQRPGEQSVEESAASLLFEIDSLAVDRIEVKSPSALVVLEKQGIDWMLREPVRARANQGTVATLIHDLKNVRSKATVSGNPEKQLMFQVDSSTGTLMKLFEKGAEKTVFIIGKAGNSITDVYLRIASSNEVLLVDAPLSPISTRPIKDWRDRAIMTLPKEGIKNVKFQYGDTTFTLTFKDSVWVIGNNATQEWVVNSLVGALAAFEADEFVDTPPSPAPRFTAFITIADYQLRFAPKKGADAFYVQSSFSPQWYEVQGWRANQVLKRKKDLVKAPS